MTNSIVRDAPTWYLAGQLAESEPIRRVTIDSTPFRIGRRSEHSLCLSCLSVSKEHAEIFEKNGALWIRDLNSTNGTYVNGRQVEEDTRLREYDLLQVASCVFRLCRDQLASDGATQTENAHERALAMMQFDRLISQNDVCPFFQPIVDMCDEDTVGFEVLGRSRLYGLMNPGDMFCAASQLDMEAELSRAFRRQGAQAARQLPKGARLFLNTHPVELAKDGLVASMHEARRIDEARPITLEIHEAAVTNLTLIRRLRTELQELNVQLAYDDFGAGQDRLSELIEVRPDCLKFDMTLVRGIHLAPAPRHQFMESLVRMVTELGIVPLAEGVEDQDEHDSCRQLGFQLGQGYYYGRPALVSQYDSGDGKVRIP